MTGAADFAAAPSADFAAAPSADFAAVDAGDGPDLVAMMDATDAWPAVRAARAWVLGEVELSGDSVVVDAGCGPGTFGVALPAGRAVDVDWSLTMLSEARRRRPGTRVVVADIARLPLRDGAARVVRAERVLQWTADPVAVLHELGRVVGPDGWLAVTDTDWGTFTIEHPDSDVASRLTTAAAAWVPHPRFARELPTALATVGAHDVRTRHDTVVLTGWDPDDAAQRDGPPGLPLHSIAPGDPDAVAAIARRARGGSFRATVTLVSCVARL